VSARLGRVWYFSTSSPSLSPSPGLALEKIVEIIPVDHINQVLKEALDWTGKKDVLANILSSESET